MKRITNGLTRKLATGSATLVLIVLGAACSDRGPASPAAPERVILICVDTLRPDHLSSYGYHRSTTPNLNRLVADEAVLFENVYASASWTLPSVASMFTSMDPPAHGVEDRGRRLSPSTPTLARSFQEAGWLTAAQITHIYVSSLFGLDSGFLEFREHSIDWKFKEGAQIRADALNRAVLPWLDHHAQNRFFLYLHYFDPHWDYDPPPPFDTMYTDPSYAGEANGGWQYLKQFVPTGKLMSPEDLAQVVALYDGEIAWTDAQLGQLFTALKSRGLWDDTLLMIVSDHGEEFQEHDSVHHIRTLYEEVIRVPMIVKLPGGRPADVRPRIPERVRLIDVAPTLTDLAGVPPSSTFQGKSMAVLLRSTGTDRTVFANTKRHESNKICLIQGRQKLIYTYRSDRPKTELYHLGEDPLESRSRTRDTPKRAKKLRATVLQMYNRGLAAARGSAPEVELTADQEEHLRALGYVE